MRGVLDGVTLLDAEATLRRASLQIAGRAPTETERAAVRAGGIDAIEPVLRAMMTGRGFHDRLIEVFNDVFMTDRSLTAIGYGGAFYHINDRAFPMRDYAGPTWMPPGRRVADSVVREPLEMVAHVVMNDRPLSEIVTGRCRLVNPLSARVYGLDVAFRDPTDLNEWREVEIPGMHEYAPGQSEYAGVITTPSFLYVVTGRVDQSQPQARATCSSGSSTRTSRARPRASTSRRWTSARTPGSRSTRAASRPMTRGSR